MTNQDKTYDGFTPSKVVKNQDTLPSQTGLPGGENSQWENLARTHAAHEREYYSVGSLWKRWGPSSEIGLVPAFGVIVLILVFVAFKIAT
jgi:hypothetical protein